MAASLIRRHGGGSTSPNFPILPVLLKESCVFQQLQLLRKGCFLRLPGLTIATDRARLLPTTADDLIFLHDIVKLFPHFYR
jgi:hypothetical protein